MSDVRFYCDCSRDRCERGLILLGTEEVDRMIREYEASGEDLEMSCQFCNRKYTFTAEDLKRIRPRTFEARQQAEKQD